MMDADKDGILGKADLIKIYDIVGKLVTDKEVSIIFTFQQHQSWD